MNLLKVTITALLITFCATVYAQEFGFQRYSAYNPAAYNAMLKKITLGSSMEQIIRNFDDYAKINGMAGFNSKHEFRVIMKDGTVKMVKSKMYADSAAHAVYLLYIDKKFKKSDPNREQKIYPSQTKQISRLHYKPNAFNNRIQDTSRVTGFAADSCWLFKILPGKISAYSFLSDYEMLDTNYPTAIQSGNKPIEKATTQTLEILIKDDEKAYKAFLKNDYYKAIKQYNNKQ